MIQGYQFDKSKVTPESDAALYSYLGQGGLDNNVASGMTATASGLNVYVATGKALVQGRWIAIQQQEQLTAQANTSGYVVVTIDLTQSNTATGTPGTSDYETINNQLRLELVDTLNQQNLNDGGMVYTFPIYSYNATGTSVVLTKYKRSFNPADSSQTKTQTAPSGYGRSVALTRIGNLVTVTSQNQYSTTPSGGAWDKKVATVPEGFRPSSDVLIYNHDLTNAMKFSWNLIKPNGDVDFFGNGSIATSDYILTPGQFWITKDSFPN